MAVKIENINDLEELATSMENYATTISSATITANKSFLTKIEGSQAEAIDQYIDVMNGLSSQVFSEFPRMVSLFSSALKTYHGELQGEGFNNIIKSEQSTVEDVYCQKFQTVQIPDSMSEAEAVKASIENVAAVLETVSGEGSAVKLAANSFEAKLGMKLTAIKSTRANVDAAQKALISMLTGTVQPGLDQCLSALERVTLLADPKSGLSPQTVIAMIKNGVVDSSSLEGLMAGLTSKDDIKAMGYLGNENYEGFFRMNPDKLSDYAYSVAVNITLSKTDILSDDAVELERILNALMRQDKKQIEGHGLRMATVSEAMAVQTALALMATPTDPELLAAYQKLSLISNLSLTAAAVSAPKNKEKLGLGQDEWYSFKNINIGHEGNLRFDINYHFFDIRTMKHPDNTLVFNNRKGVLVNGEEHSKIMSGLAEKIRKLEVEKDKRVQELIKNGIITGVGLYNPALGAALGLFVGTVENLSDKNGVALEKTAVSELSKLFPNEKDKIKALNNLLTDIYSFNEKNKKIDKEIKGLAKSFYDAITGVGISTLTLKEVNKKDSITVFSGIPSKESLESLAYLNQNGIQDFLDEESYTILETRFKESGLSDEEKFLLGQDGIKLTDLDPGELNGALSEIAALHVDRPNKSVDELIDWIQNHGWK